MPSRGCRWFLLLAAAGTWPVWATPKEPAAAAVKGQEKLVENCRGSFDMARNARPYAAYLVLDQTGNPCPSFWCGKDAGERGAGGNLVQVETKCRGQVSVMGRTAPFAGTARLEFSEHTPLFRLEATFPFPGPELGLAGKSGQGITATIHTSSAPSSQKKMPSNSTEPVTASRGLSGCDASIVRDIPAIVPLTARASLRETPAASGVDGMMTWRGTNGRRLLGLLTLLAHGVAWAEDPRTLRGHDGWIASVAVSPDGELVFSGGDDGSLQHWKLRAAELVGTLRTYPKAVTALSCHPDGKRIAVGLHDGRVELCDARDGTTIREFAGHDDTVTVICFDPSGNCLASGSADDSLRIWDIRDGTLLHTFRQGHEYDVVTAAFRPDGRRIVTGDGENELKVWDAGTGAELETLRGHEGTVTSVAYSPCGKRMVSASWDATLRVWDAETGRHLHTLRGHEADVTAVLFTPDGSRIVSASEDNTIRIWDAVTYEPQRTLPTDHVTRMAISPDGQTLVCGGKQSIRLWNLAPHGSGVPKK